MAKREPIEIRPGSPEWDAWFDFYSGDARQREMRDCLISGAAFQVWRPKPTAHQLACKARRLAREAPLKAAIADGVDAVAERLERRAVLDAQDAEATKERERSTRKRGEATARAFDQVNVGQRPSVKGAPDLGVVVTHDPFELEEVAAGKRTPEQAKPRAKLTNLRDDPVGLLHRRSQVSDLQLAAARYWQAQHDAAAIGGARGIDPTREKVDGGKLADPNTDARMHAVKELARIDARLGDEGAVLVRRVLGEAMEIQQVAAIRGDTSERGRKYVGLRLRECLDTIVAVVGLEAEGARPRSLHDVHAEMARVAREPELHRAVRRARSG